MRKLAFFGAGGHTQEVEMMINPPEKIIRFVDELYVNENNLDVKYLNVDDYDVLVTIGISKIRKQVVETKLPPSTNYHTFIHPTAIIGKNVSIGKGSYIGPYCIVTENIVLGNFTILNRGVQVGHDCIIGDYFSAMPGAIVSGNCVIGECVYLGSNSSIKEKISICDNITIGLNAGVVKNITEEGTYVGVPANKK